MDNKIVPGEEGKGSSPQPRNESHPEEVTNKESVASKTDQRNAAKDGDSSLQHIIDPSHTNSEVDPTKSNGSLFVSPALPDDNLSELNDDETSPPSSCSSDRMKCQEDETIDTGQIVVGTNRNLFGFLVAFIAIYGKAIFPSFPTQETFREGAAEIVVGTSWNSSNFRARHCGKPFPTQESCCEGPAERVVIPSQVYLNMGPYLNHDGSFKDFKYYKKCGPGTVIFAASETVYRIEVGGSIGSFPNVFESSCQCYVLKRCRFLKKELDAWNQLPPHKNVMRLRGVIMCNPSQKEIHQLTDKMTSDLWKATCSITLEALAKDKNPGMWLNIFRNVKYVMRCILRSVLHLNRHGFQHFDVKEPNFFVGRPSRCECPNIFQCACCIDWIIKLGDFGTLSSVERPTNWEGGTEFYLPPEAKKYHPQYKHPTYDSWSILIMLLHFCVGRASNSTLKVDILAKQLGGNKECMYANEKLMTLQSVALEEKRMVPFARFVRDCLQADYEMRPTPEEMLQKWEAISAQ